MNNNERVELLRLYAKIELARRDFFCYCNLMAPDFYKPERQYLVSFCHDLQAFYESGEKVLVVNLPPRHGKSRTAGLFVEWILGRNRREKIMTGSYNELLSTVFAKTVRNDIQAVKADRLKAVYSDVFPRSRIKKGDGAMNLWSLTGGYNNFLATSPTATATGFGCTLLIIDDLIKNAYEACNEEILDKHWQWFTNTMLSRLEEGGKIIIIMTRWATGDLAGRVLSHYKTAGRQLRHICLKARAADGSMLCEEILSAASYEEKIKLMGEAIAAANYGQEPLDLQGRLYSSFKTYAALPCDARGNLLFTDICNYTDTADEGGDFLCGIDYGVYNGEAYVLNLLYTQAAMEVTEPGCAAMLYADKVRRADIESNNGGRGFARAVERLLREEYGSNLTEINAFYQAHNKKARILSNATWVMEHIYLPLNWRERFPEFYRAVADYQREGKNAHDDAPDALSGIAEKLGVGARFSFE